jgi:cellulose synthase/poly-beta-1,6-N-acetylglucosamine synthase-like glycosyltransferase
MTRWHVGVIEPARDEELLLGRCLASVREAIACSGVPADRVRVVVVADACRDATAELAARLLRGWGEVLEIDRGSAGWARHEGVGVILDGFAMVPRRQVWLANTDADSAAPRSWLADQLQLADSGVAAVAGVVRVDSFRDHPPLVRRRFELCYRGPADTHPHVHGANLGVRADAYEAAGGWPTVDLAEDQGLWQNLAAGGWPIVSTRSIVVTTSGRGVGRARGGFADLLAALGEDA